MAHKYWPNITKFSTLSYGNVYIMTSVVDSTSVFQYRIVGNVRQESQYMGKKFSTFNFAL